MNSWIEVKDEIEERIDSYLAKELNISRSKVQKLIKQGLVIVNEKVISSNYIVKVGDTVKQGQVIGYVGPKNVYGVKGNIYFDENGKPTNGATTGPHLHLGIRIDGKYVNPLDFF